MAEGVRIDGLQELDMKLEALGEVAGKKVLRGAMMDAASPIWKAARGNASAPSFKDSGALAAAMGRWFKQTRRNRFVLWIGPRSRSRKGLALWAQQHGGPPRSGTLRHAHIKEFGSKRTKPEPWLRPAFFGNLQRATSIFGNKLGKRIDKVARTGR